MNLQFLFAFNHILETSDYYTGDFEGGEWNHSSEMNEVEMILESFYR